MKATQPRPMPNRNEFSKAPRVNFGQVKEAKSMASPNWTIVSKRLAAANIPTTLPAGRVFLVLAPFAWGKSPSLKEAHSNALSNRAASYEGPDGWRFILYDAPSSAFVDDMGYLRWTYPADHTPDDHSQDPKELYRYGRFESQS